MSETLHESFQPCLLDRLADDDPEPRLAAGSDAIRRETRNYRGFSMQRYREGVLRDLRWLLNAPSHPERDGFSEFPEAVRSVINFGIPDLCGLTSNSLNFGELERELTEIIIRFEPRILRQGLSVKINVGVQKKNPNIIGFEIRGMLWANPLPEQLFLKSEIDLETGQCVF